MRILLQIVACGIVFLLAAGLFVEVTMYRPGDAPEGLLAVTGARILVGEDLEPRDGAVVLVEQGTIVDIIDADAPLPADATVVDGAGATLLPGLIDLHVHLGMPALNSDREPGLSTMPRLILNLARFAPGARRDLVTHGVTTVRSVGDDLDWITDLRRQLRDHELEGPRLLVAGPVVTTVGGHPVATVHDGQVDEGTVQLPTTPDDARAIVERLAAGDEPVDLIKVVHDRGDDHRPLDPLPVDVLDAVVTAARDRGLPVTAHWSNRQDLLELLDAGVAGLEHLESRDLLDGWPEELLTRLLDADVPVTTTLAATEAALPPDVVERLTRRAGELAGAGGRVVLGTDAGMPGVPFGASAHRELELLVVAGLAPRDALRAATSEAARVLGRDDLGVITPGAAADLLLVGSDPLQDIGAIRDVLMVFRDGRLVVDQRERHAG